MKKSKNATKTKIRGDLNIVLETGLVNVDGSGSLDLNKYQNEVKNNLRFKCHADTGIRVLLILRR